MSEQEAGHLSKTNRWVDESIDLGGAKLHRLYRDGQVVCEVEIETDGSASWAVYQPHEYPHICLSCGDEVANPLVNMSAVDVAKAQAASVWARYEPMYDRMVARAAKREGELLDELATAQKRANEARTKPIYTEEDLRGRVKLLDEEARLRAQAPVSATDLLITRGGQRISLSKEALAKITKIASADLHAQAEALRDQALGDTP